MTGASYTPLARIAVPNGDVFHGLRIDEKSYGGFGEAYFSTIDHAAVKGWRRHRLMIMNLIVPVGRVRFVVTAGDGEAFRAFDLGPEDGSYGRLTVPAGLWMAFQGRAPGLNLVLNLASILHDPAEAETRQIDTFGWNWDA